MIFTIYISEFMPCPCVDTKFVLSILKFYTGSVFGMLKSEILLHKLAHLSIPKKIEYHTRAIITREFYIFYSLLEDPFLFSMRFLKKILFLCKVSIQEGFLIKSGL